MCIRDRCSRQKQAEARRQNGTDHPSAPGKVQLFLCRFGDNPLESVFIFSHDGLNLQSLHGLGIILRGKGGRTGVLFFGTEDEMHPSVREQLFFRRCAETENSAVTVSFGQAALSAAPGFYQRRDGLQKLVFLRNVLSLQICLLYTSRCV